MATQQPAPVSNRNGVAITRILNPSGEHAFLNTGQNMTFVVDNSGGAVDIDVTIRMQSSVDGVDVPDRDLVTVAAGDVAEFGPFDAANYNVKTGADASRVVVLFANGDAASAVWASESGSLK